MRNDDDSLTDWLLKSLELETTLFHLGQYCGAWRASTTGLAKAGFHIVLRGACWLHLPDDDRSLPLHEGDCIFFLRDVAHTLAPTPALSDGLPPVGSVPMQPIDLSVHDAVALACGFFGFRAGFAEALMASFPPYIVIPAHGSALQAIRPLFELVLAEANRGGPTPSALVARLVDLMFYYVIRDLTARSDVAGELWAVMAAPAFAPLLQALIDDPGHDWTVEAMAAFSHMSRATFFKRFTQTAGVAPAQFLLLLRMNVAAQMIADGVSIARAAERVGYQSDAAFSRAFKKTIGLLPGAYRRSRTINPGGAADADRMDGPERGRMSKETRPVRVAARLEPTDNLDL